MESTSIEPGTRTFAIGETAISLGILPIDSKYKIPPMGIIANEKRTKPKIKDQKLKYERQYIERTITLKANEKKSYSSLVNQLPQQQQSYKKQADKCMGILKIDDEGNVSFNFCSQKQDFKLNVNLVQTKNDIYKIQQQNQLRMMDGRRKSQGPYSHYTNQQGQNKDVEGQKQKVKEKKTKAKAINSDQQDDPYSGNDSD